ncbi:hypothetical protein BH10BDE1_BH10BDE1_33890 [soil metagenome]
MICMPRVRSIFSFGILSLSMSFALSGFAFAAQNFPEGPRAEMTPGSLCQKNSGYRYPEHIKYCNRSVDSGMKNEIIKEYDQTFGYSVRSMPRRAFKIDHLIPLCAGGSNNQDNLWPQHESVYAITDPLEPLVCEKMADGKLSQADAVQLIHEAKNDLSKVAAIISHLESL